MTNTTWLLLLLLFIFEVFSNDSLLSKFHQNTYKLKDVRAEMNSYSEKYYNFFEIKTFKVNRTTAAVNVTLRMKISIGDKLEAVVQAYKFLSNEYRIFPVRFQVNVRKGVESGALGAGNIKNCGNLTVFYFEKDVVYHACNFVVDEKKLPPLIPNGRYKAELTLMYLNEEIGVIYVFGEVYTPIVYPKSRSKN